MNKKRQLIQAVCKNKFESDNDDIFFLEFFFDVLGEVVVGDENVDIIGRSEGIGHDFADFGGIEHHVHHFRAGEDKFQEIGFHLRDTGEALFKRESRSGNDGEFEIRIAQENFCIRGSGGEVFFDEGTSDENDFGLFFMGEFFSDHDAVGKDMAGTVGEFFGELESGRAAVKEHADALVDQRNRFFCDDLFGVGIDGRLLSVGFARAFLYFQHGHGAAAHADDFIFFFQLQQIAAERHIGNFGELNGKFLQAHFSVLFDQKCDLVDSRAFRKRIPPLFVFNRDIITYFTDIRNEIYIICECFSEFSEKFFSWHKKALKFRRKNV